MTLHVAPHTEQFTSVAVLIANLKAAHKPAPQPVAPMFQVGQRVTLDYCGTARIGTVMEVHAHTGFVRVEIDRVTMHEWAHPDRLTLVEDVVTVGATVTPAGFGVDAEVIAVLPPAVEGGVTIYRCRWMEPLAKFAPREANFWRQDVVLKTGGQGQQKAANP